MQIKLVDDKKEQIDWDSLYVNFVDNKVFYKNEVMTLDLFKEKYRCE